MKVSEMIKSKREQLGISIKEFSDALCMGSDGESLFRSWENGMAEPDKDTLKAIKGFAKKTPYAVPVENPKFRFIDLFAGIGGIRIPFQELGGECVFSSEWDKFSQKTYRVNFGEIPAGDITKIDAKSIPDFDILLGGFPCQPFSQLVCIKALLIPGEHFFLK